VSFPAQGCVLDGEPNPWSTVMRPLVTALFAALFAAGPAHAATYVVNTTDIDLPDADTTLAGCDGNPILAGDQCTLRAAIMQANAGASADTIVLPLDVTITLTIGGTGAAESGDLDITQPVTITGAPLGYPNDEMRLPVIVAPNSNRIFDVTAGVAVTFQGVRLTGGNPSGLNGTNGGALRVLSTSADVLVEHSKISSNQAVDGGGISTAGTLEVRDSDLWVNRVTGNGSSLYVSGAGTATIPRQQLSRRGRPVGARGGGLRRPRRRAAHREHGVQRRHRSRAADAERRRLRRPAATAPDSQQHVHVLHHDGGRGDRGRRLRREPLQFRVRGQRRRGLPNYHARGRSAGRPHRVQPSSRPATAAATSTPPTFSTWTRSSSR
jgi:hypothetical protein